MSIEGMWGSGGNEWKNYREKRVAKRLKGSRVAGSMHPNCALPNRPAPHLRVWSLPLIFHRQKINFHKISIFPKSEPNPSPFGHYIGGDGFFYGERCLLPENRLLSCVTNYVQAKPPPRLFASGDRFQSLGEKNTPENDAICCIERLGPKTIPPLKSDIFRYFANVKQQSDIHAFAAPDRPDRRMLNRIAQFA
jgi:hypothetical protein